MTPRRRRASDSQLDLFATAKPLSGPASFAGIEQWAAANVGRILKEDPRSREEIAGAVSSLLGGEISKLMLDAYASEAREGHNISFGKALALIGATQDRHFIEEAVDRLGGRIFWGEEVKAARLGSMQAQYSALGAEIRALRASVKPIDRKGSRA